MLKVCNELETAPLWIDESSDLGILDLRGKARRLHAREIEAGRGGLGLIIVDYIQLMRADDPRANRVEQVGQMSRGLKLLARELGVPVIALSQLSRAPEQRTGRDKRPILSDLRESGNLEQDADIVAFIYREDYYETLSRTRRTGRPSEPRELERDGRADRAQEPQRPDRNVKARPVAFERLRGRLSQPFSAATDGRGAAFDRQRPGDWTPPPSEAGARGSCPLPTVDPKAARLPARRLRRQRLDRRPKPVARPCDCRERRRRSGPAPGVARRSRPGYRGARSTGRRSPDMARDAGDAPGRRAVRESTVEPRRRLAEGRGLWLMGDVGTGKTTLAMLVSAAARGRPLGRDLLAAAPARPHPAHLRLRPR